MKHFFFFASVTDEHEFKEDNLLNIGEFTNEITPLIVVIIMYKNLCKLLNILKYYWKFTHLLIFSECIYTAYRI